MHAVIRRYTGASQLIAEMDRRQQEVERIIATVPGFVAYHAMRVGADALTTISVCQDRTGTMETTRRAAEWVRDNLPPNSIPAPEVSDGTVFLSFGAPQTLGAAVRA